MRPHRRIPVDDHCRIRWVFCFGLLIFAACFFAMMLWAGRATAATASWYGSAFAGKRTASGEIFDTRKLTCAHPTLPMNTFLLLHRGGRLTHCRVNDRGPFIAGRQLDLSPAVFARLADPDVGLIRVRMERVP